MDISQEDEARGLSAAHGGRSLVPLTLELRHIRYFMAVAEHLSFRKAAKRLNMAQPPLSRQIRQLEDDLGVSLFARDKRGVALTKVGHAFLAEATKLMVQAGHAVEAARYAKVGDARVVRIGIASGLGGIVSRIVLGFRNQWHGIQVECHDVFSSYQNQALRQCEIDVGFLRPPIDHAALQCELLYEEEFVVIVPRTHRLAKQRSVRIRDIADEPLILFDRSLSSGLYDKILGLYTSHGLTPRLYPSQLEAHEEAGAITLALGRAIFVGTGAIMNRTVAGIELASLRLREPEAKIEVYAAWRKGEPSSAVRSFLDCMHSALRGNPRLGSICGRIA
jgi:DNA-binding transcriptional LysR family regulator